MYGAMCRAVCGGPDPDGPAKNGGSMADDVMNDFISEKCRVNPEATTPKSMVYAAYEHFCKKRGALCPGTAPVFHPAVSDGGQHSPGPPPHQNRPEMVCSRTGNQARPGCRHHGMNPYKNLFFNQTHDFILSARHEKRTTCANAAIIGGRGHVGRGVDQTIPVYAKPQCIECKSSILLQYIVVLHFLSEVFQKYFKDRSKNTAKAPRKRLKTPP